MQLLNNQCYINQTSYSRGYHIFLKNDLSTHDKLNQLAYYIGMEYNLISCEVGCLYVKWKSFLEAYNFKGWSYSTRFCEFPNFRLESEAKRFIMLLNAHCLIQIK